MLFREFQTQEPTSIAWNEEQENVGRGFWTKGAELTWEVETRREAVPGCSRSMRGYIFWLTPGFDSSVLSSEGNLNFCVSSTPLRAKRGKKALLGFFCFIVSVTVLPEFESDAARMLYTPQRYSAPDRWSERSTYAKWKVPETQGKRVSKVPMIHIQSFCCCFFVLVCVCGVGLGWGVTVCGSE